MAFAKVKGVRIEVYEYNSLISLFKGLLLKMPTKIRISAMFCELCARVYSGRQSGRHS